MKHFLLICSLLFVGFSFRANAGNSLGSELTYGAISAYSYQVNFTFIQDCSATLPDSTVNLQIISPGCNAGRIVVLRRSNSTRVIEPFCPKQPTYCGIPGVVATRFAYAGIVTFSQSEQSCSDWYLRVTTPTINRAPTANLNSSGTFYNEAYLYLANGVLNNSVQYDQNNIPLAFFYPNQTNTIYSLNTQDFDTSDSLSYSLVPALQAPNSPVTYQSGYSSQVPFQSTSGINFNSTIGQFKFTTPAIVPNVPRSQGANRYTLAVEIKEWRKINGIRRIVGATRREMVIEIIPLITQSNQPPQFVNFTINGQPFNPSQALIIPVGQQSIIHFGTSDPDLSDSLSLKITHTLNNSSLLTQTVGKRPEITINWTPTLADVSNLPYSFNFILEDEGCPVRGVVSEGFILYVVNPTGLNSELDADLKFSASPNPCRDYFTFHVSSNQKAYSEIIIRNVLGQEVDRIQLNKTYCQEINWAKASKFPAGQYSAQLIGESKSSTQIKFIKLP